MTTLPDLSGLRTWQVEAITVYLNTQQSDFMVTATPGAGKTTFALTLARHLLQERRIDRIIVVVPTDHLRTQWGNSAKDAGLLLDPTLGNDRILDKEYDGYIATYAQVASHPTLHERRTESPHRTLVIFDEIHHTGDGLSWGEAVRQAFAPASRRLALTGTPFRTSSVEQIPFVRYEPDGEGALRSVSDYTYGYSHALNDSVVRPVLFAAYSGVARWRNSIGDLLAASLSDTLTNEDEMAAWKTVLNPNGQWVPHVLQAAVDRLEEIRQSGQPDAACIILASDQETARAYAAVLKSVTGQVATIVLSEDPKASDKISAFTNGSEKFMVAVRMVSEGVDIPRAAVLVWLTSYRTPLFFAQAVGRVVRARNPRESATVFLPAVRPLLALAAEIETERDHVLAAKGIASDIEFDAIRNEETEPGMSTKIEAVEAQASFAHALFNGRAIMGSHDLSEEEEDFLGLPGLLSPQETAILLAKRKKELQAQAKKGLHKSHIEVPVVDTVAVHERQASLRKEITGLVNQVASRTGADQASVHIQTRRAVSGPANPQASPDILEARRDWLLARLH
jgi:superfamily II DNA or RNA helicase